jgi:hypothetical protein
VGRKRTASGTLIAIDGTRGADVRDAAARLWRHLQKKAKGGISSWDASGAFSDLWMGRRAVTELSPRTLALLFASDLAFRLRWQIRPALEQGQTIVAAPYVESVMAFASAAGLPKKWLAEVFRFAPRPSVTYRVKERKKSSGWNGKALDGFPEFCSVALGEDVEADAAGLRTKMIAYLDALERRKGCKRLRKRALGA